jgi:hypothetical protein
MIWLLIIREMHPPPCRDCPNRGAYPMLAEERLRIAGGEHLFSMSGH